jgi:hypothetical protein
VDPAQIKRSGFAILVENHKADSVSITKDLFFFTTSNVLIYLQVPVSVPRLLVAGSPRDGVCGLLPALERLHLTADWADTVAEAAGLLQTHSHKLIIVLLRESAIFNATHFIRYLYIIV